MQKKRTQNFGLLLFFAIALVLVFSLVNARSGRAQSDEDGWAPPLNLSNSGGMTNPVMVVDAEDRLHVFWQDVIGEVTVYTQRVDGQWASPTVVQAPFETFTPTMVVDSTNKIHAFWTDSENKLYRSSVAAANAADGLWTPEKQIAESALDFDVVIDSNDLMHVSYVRGIDIPEIPAGVYYMRSSFNGVIWTQPELIYASSYLRTLSVGESSEDANVNIAQMQAGDAHRLYLTWDNPPLNKVFLAVSEDGGNNWREPQEIDKPSERAGDSGPSNIMTYVQGERVLLLWQVPQSESRCAQYYQWSVDGGSTWQPRQQMLEDIFGCPSDIQIMEDDEGNLLLQVNAIEVYLLHWNGSRWSNPRPQATLAGFPDPVSRRSVNLACLQSALLNGEIYVVGCDANDNNDIWLLKRPLGDVTPWYADESKWSLPVFLSENEVGISSLNVVTDNQERIHTIWSQKNSAEVEGSTTSIYYARWDKDQLWSQPMIVLSSLIEGIEQPKAALDPANRLLVVWIGEESGKVFFSRVNAGLAIIPAEWSRPRELPVDRSFVNSLDIRVDQDGEIYVVYSVTINEGRGIYLIKSQDGGETWSDPIQVFDGVAAGWEMVDLPHLSLIDEDRLQLIWARFSLPSTNQPVALYYANSMDGGANWSEPELVTDKPAAWSQIVSQSVGSVNRIWNEGSSGEQITFRHEQSVDSGNTWTSIEPFTIFDRDVNAIALTRDASNRLHLLLLTNRAEKRHFLQHWQWDGESWTRIDGLDLSDQKFAQVDSLVADFSPSGKLIAIVAGWVEDSEGKQTYKLFFTERQLELSGAPQPDQPAPTSKPTATPEPSFSPTPEPTTTPTPDLSKMKADQVEDTESNTWEGLVAGVTLAGLVVMIVFGIGLRSSLRENKPE